MQAPLVVGLGRIGVAISALGPNLPGIDGGSSELAALSTSPAPGVAVALRAALQLGCRARAVGTHGADLLGQLARSALRDAGIEVELLRAVGTSACDLVMVAGDGKLRSHYRGDRGEPVTIDSRAALDGASALLIDGSEPGAQLVAAEAAKKLKLPVIFDVSELREGTSDLISMCDILIASEREASELAPRGELTDALDELIGLGPRAVVITLGAEGAIGRHGPALVRCPAFATDDMLDSYGAGSVFHGAFAAALLSELPFHRCMELGAAAASLSLRELGPWSAMPTREDVLALTRTRRAG
ncbi:MAG: carbohydrate kinase family protein [Deltaproteobacteria bacterium]|nr:carbohydrate kinase family protein [Deltaproteobacteria bacterium]